MVVATEELTPRMLRLTLEGPGVAAVGEPEPAGSVRLLIPSPGSEELVLPEWDGNVWLLPGGDRAVVRTFTPQQVDAAAARMVIDVVRHSGGAVSTWAESAEVGAEVAMSGPARGYLPDPAAERFVLFADETALPAMTQVIGAIHEAAIEAHIEVTAVEARLPLPDRPGLEAAWHVADRTAEPGASLVDAAGKISAMEQTTRIWAAGEAASMQKLRKYFSGGLAVPRSQLSIRGYWRAAMPAVAGS